MAGVVRALVRLHACGIVHRDVRMPTYTIQAVRLISRSDILAGVLRVILGESTERPGALCLSPAKPRASGSYSDGKSVVHELQVTSKGSRGRSLLIDFGLA